MKKFEKLFYWILIYDNFVSSGFFRFIHRFITPADKIFKGIILLRNGTDKTDADGESEIRKFLECQLSYLLCYTFRYLFRVIDIQINK